jgi:hypothetical protein
MTNSFPGLEAGDAGLKWPSEDPVMPGTPPFDQDQFPADDLFEERLARFFDQDEGTDTSVEAPYPPLFDQDRLPADDDRPDVRDVGLWSGPSGSALRHPPRTPARRRRVLLAVMAVVTIPLGVLAALSFALSGDGGEDGRRTAAERPTRPVFDGTIRIPHITVEPVPALAALPEPVPSTPQAAAPTTSFTAPRSAGGGAPPTTATAAASAATPSQPAPPPTTAAAPPTSAPASNPNPVCSVLPVLCQ